MRGATRCGARCPCRLSQLLAGLHAGCRFRRCRQPRIAGHSLPPAPPQPQLQPQLHTTCTHTHTHTHTHLRLQCDACGSLLNPTELIDPKCKLTGEGLGWAVACVQLLRNRLAVSGWVGGVGGHQLAGQVLQVKPDGRPNHHHQHDRHTHANHLPHRPRLQAPPPWCARPSTSSWTCPSSAPTCRQGRFSLRRLLLSRLDSSGRAGTEVGLGQEGCQRQGQQGGPLVGAVGRRPCAPALPLRHTVHPAHPWPLLLPPCAARRPTSTAPRRWAAGAATACRCGSKRFSTKKRHAHPAHTTPATWGLLPDTFPAGAPSLPITPPTPPTLPITHPTPPSLPSPGDQGVDGAGSQGAVHHAGPQVGHPRAAGGLRGQGEAPGVAAYGEGWAGILCGGVWCGVVLWCGVWCVCSSGRG